jgi:hypothetical protein
MKIDNTRQIVEETVASLPVTTTEERYEHGSGIDHSIRAAATRIVDQYGPPSLHAFRTLDTDNALDLLIDAGFLLGVEYGRRLSNGRSSRAKRGNA